MRHFLSTNSHDCIALEAILTVKQGSANIKVTSVPSPGALLRRRRRYWPKWMSTESLVVLIIARLKRNWKRRRRSHKLICWCLCIPFYQPSTKARSRLYAPSMAHDINSRNHRTHLRRWKKPIALKSQWRVVVVAKFDGKRLLDWPNGVPGAAGL